jgi:hypothetical protein
MSYDLDKDLRRIIPYDLYLKLISPRQLLFDFHFSEAGSNGPVPLDMQQFCKK